MSYGPQKFPEVSLCPGAGHPTEKGGALAAVNGANVEIYTSMFESNNAPGVSGYMLVCRNFLTFPPCPGV
jgi:hypothetical protein